MSSFGGLSVALSGLQAQRRAMDVTGQNVANVNTVGYTRQRANLQSLGPVGVDTMQGNPRQTGDGVIANSVVRLSDSFASARLRQEESSTGYLSTRRTVLEQVETRFLEPGPDGLSAELGELWSAWGDVSNHPEDIGARKVLLQQASTVVARIAAGHDGVSAQWDATRQQVGALTSEVNEVATSIAELNGHIRSATQVGAPANELSDARDQLVLRLTGMVGATTRPGPDGTVDIMLGGSALVRGSKVNALADAGPTSMAAPGGAAVRLQWADGTPAALGGGSVQALLDAVNTDLPRAGAGYDTLAASLAGAVNALHSAGTGLDGVNGRDFFTGTTASTLAVAALTPDQVGAAGPLGGLDGSAADAIADLASAGDGPDAAWASFVVGFGVDAQAAGRRAATAEVVRRDALNALMSTTGVDVDEEMTMLVQFQRAYEGAARVLTAVDQALDTLINRTGLVGR